MSLAERDAEVNREARHRRIRHSGLMMAMDGTGKLEIDTRLASVRAAHRALDERIAQLVKEGHKDQVELQRLKKQKLAIRDHIAQLENDSLPDIIA